jgi:HAD superfamily hydrolase (TIGR01484 family)
VAALNCPYFRREPQFRAFLMRFQVLACDYDGTLATAGRVGPDVVEGLRRVRASGRRLLLVTGRIVSELLELFSEITLFDRIVAENGGLLYDPTTRQARALAEPPPPEFVEHLRQAGVQPISLGQVIVATWEPHEVAVLRTIQELGLELQVIFNKGAVMVLPSGVNKATGLLAALRELGHSPRQVVAVGDAENDHTFLNACGCGVAVANALPVLSERADWTTNGDHGAGVLELIEQLLRDDLQTVLPKLLREDVN